MAAQRSGSSRNSGGSRSGGSRGSSPRNSGSDSRGGSRSKGGGSKGGGYKGKRGDSDSLGGYKGKRGESDSRGGYKGKRGDSDSRGGYKGGGQRDGKPRTSAKGAHAARRNDRPKPPSRAERSGWGSVAQHGAAGATIGQRRDEEERTEPFTAEERRKFEQRQAKRDAIAARQADLRSQAQDAIDRGGLPASSGDRSTPTIVRRPLPGRPPNPRHVPKEMEKVAGKPKAERSWQLFKRAAREFEEERYTDSHRTVKPLAKDFAEIVEVQELYGLCLYRLGRWDEAIEVLEGFRDQSKTTEQNPVLMDCHRAAGNWADVDELWSELGEHSPSPELMAEGRIVMAGAHSDRGRLDDAIRLLEKGWKPPRTPQPHHLRRAYALADMLERDGKLPRSRKLFAWIAAKDASYLDSAERAGH